MSFHRKSDFGIIVSVLSNRLLYSIFLSFFFFKFFFYYCKTSISVSIWIGWNFCACVCFYYLNESQEETKYKLHYLLFVFMFRVKISIFTFEPVESSNTSCFLPIYRESQKPGMSLFSLNVIKLKSTIKLTKLSQEWKGSAEISKKYR